MSEKGTDAGTTNKGRPGYVTLVSQKTVARDIAGTCIKQGWYVEVAPHQSAVERRRTFVADRRTNMLMEITLREDVNLGEFKRRGYLFQLLNERVAVDG